MRKLIYDATGTVIRTVHLNNPTDLFGGGVIEIKENVDPLLAEVQYQRDVQAALGKPKDGMRLAAMMPRSEYERACREGWINDPVAMRKWINDASNRDFKVIPGRA